jgi:hypothetical protein
VLQCRVAGCGTIYLKSQDTDEDAKRGRAGWSILQCASGALQDPVASALAAPPDTLVVTHSSAALLTLCLAACSASNYLLGLTPVELGPLVIGTVAGMSVWSILYASLGGASKALLESGADLDVLLAGEATAGQV